MSPLKPTGKFSNQRGSDRRSRVRSGGTTEVAAEAVTDWRPSSNVKRVRIRLKNVEGIKAANHAAALVEDWHPSEHARQSGATRDK